MKIILRALVIVGCILTAGIAVDGLFGTGILVGESEAVIGRPRTPISVAGTARRTTRRRIRRTTVYMASLPRGCSTVVVEGVALHRCGGTYYQPYGSQFVVVHVD